jgi:hypothetical protein
MKLVYIAAPFRGKNAWEVEQNIRVAENLGLAVAEMGAVPVIPHTMYRFFDGTLEDRFWLDATLQLMHKCDAMLLGAGWRRSEGAGIESDQFHRPQFEHLPDLKKWLAENA